MLLDEDVTIFVEVDDEVDLVVGGIPIVFVEPKELHTTPDVTLYLNIDPVVTIEVDNLTAPTGVVTRYGVISRHTIALISTSGIRISPPGKYGATSTVYTFSRTTSARRRTTGIVTRPITLSIATAGSRAGYSNFYGSGLYGAGPYSDLSTAPTVYSSGDYGMGTYGSGVGSTISYGVVARPITFIKSVAGLNPSGSTTVYSYGQYGVGTYGQLVAGQYGNGTYGSGVYNGGPGTYSGSVAMPLTFTKAVAGKIPGTTQTPIAEISLASHGTPSSRTQHTIKIRARTTSGSGGVIKAALYEGSTNISGVLTSSGLTTSLADYTLTIPDASAAAITSYSDLTLKIWGYHPSGTALVFEVANVYLQLPT